MSQSPDDSARARRKVTTNRLRQMKERGEKIACLTAYDQVMAKLLDDSGIDVILVGDSVSTVMQGLDTTVTVTMDHMLYHSTLVRRGVERALVVGDMPLMSYQVNPDEALRTRPVDGMEIVWGFDWDARDERWESGRIYDPKNGKTYRCYIELREDGTLKVRGYIGFALIGRTEIWTRVTD